MPVLGVIPAAGKGSRWGGYYKELLPCGDGEWLIDRTVEAMLCGGADAVLIVTRIEKMAALAEHLRYASLPVYFTIQHGDNDIWSAIEESFGFIADRYLFAMPDTYFPLDAFETVTGGSFSLILHETTRPERFGVLVEGTVINKAELTPGTYSAWGLLSWDRQVVRFWQRIRPGGYTDAINTAIREFGLDYWTIPYYYDMATFEDYQGWIQDEEYRAWKEYST
jgi:dTDP-glucose pyrophosphorylase